MPIYEYRCQSCQHKMEVMQKLSDPELTDCPSCHQPQLKKLISVVGFRFKGSGWYETDFKQGQKKNIAQSDSAPSSDSKSSDSNNSKSDSSSSSTSIGSNGSSNSSNSNTSSSTATT
ncbi:MAG: FmdB family transcriptional regulator [Candidatus Contendobacter odensis]|uniref:FmdB family transcriptional regulator n=1 Tax=Candidatus Contendibacter odensensis TaxID=1400860 RepID=A0A2G6PEF0_9GAMM|nr:MAG: FmdB family transcriptional regulator [Candidatus Contendobacter odensis]